MAIVWSEFIGDNHYEVRSAGASLRLYRNGVHHSQYNPTRPLSGGIWDLLTITSLFREPALIENGLILGFGAGAAARLLRELVSPERIVGIDLDPIHLSIADSFFDCSEGCELLATDAVEWVYETSGAGQGQTKVKDSLSETFDWILDDLYGEEDSIPVRVGPVSLKWFRTLANRVSANGMLVINFVEPSQIQALPIMTNLGLQNRFPNVIELSMTAYDNRVLAFSRQPFDLQKFETRLSEVVKRFPACRGVRSKYEIKTVRSG